MSGTWGVAVDRVSPLFARVSLLIVLNSVATLYKRREEVIREGKWGGGIRGEKRLYKRREETMRVITPGE